MVFYELVFKFLSLLLPWWFFSGFELPYKQIQKNQLNSL